jgi:hypothetical protein
VVAANTPGNKSAAAEITMNLTCESWPSRLKEEARLLGGPLDAVLPIGDRVVGAGALAFPARV